MSKTHTDLTCYPRKMVSDIMEYKLKMFLEARAIILRPTCLILLQITFLFPFSQGLIAEINGLDSWTIWFNQAIWSSEWNKWSYFIQAHGNWSLCYLKKIEGFEISSESTKWWKALISDSQIALNSEVITSFYAASGHRLQTVQGLLFHFKNLDIVLEVQCHHISCVLFW